MVSERVLCISKVSVSKTKSVCYKNNSNRSRTTTQPAQPAPPAPRIHLSVAVYTAEPLDYQKYRHAALCLRPDNGEKPMIVHLIGPNRAYQLETRNESEPSASAKFAKEVRVGWLGARMTKAQLANFVRQTPIDNESREFDCQKWVANALQRLASARYLTNKECGDGINGMVDATMEAAEESE